VASKTRIRKPIFISLLLVATLALRAFWPWTATASWFRRTIPSRERRISPHYRVKRPGGFCVQRLF